MAGATGHLNLLGRLDLPGNDTILGYVPGVAGMHDIDDYPGARQVPGLVVYRYDAPLCFANAEDFRRWPQPPRHRRHCAGSCSTPRPTSRWTAPRPTRWRRCTLSVSAEGWCSRWLGSSRTCATSARAGLIDTIGEERIFMTLPTAVAAYRSWHHQRFGPLSDDPTGR